MKFLLRLAIIFAAISFFIVALLWSWMNRPEGKMTLAASIISEIAAHREDVLLSQGVDQQRQGQRKTVDLLRDKPLEMAKVVDISFNSNGINVPMRWYLPIDSSATLPCVLYFHGGGWVFGGLDSHDHVARKIANISRSVVIAVDYRKAPENPFPAAIDDAWAALQWIYHNASTLRIDPSKIAVAGDSAGGNIAAALALRTLAQNGPGIRAQVLMYPVTDTQTFARISYDKYGKGFFLTRERMAWFIHQYVPEPSMRQNPYASPLRARELHGLPPALIITAEFDPLRSEAEAYEVELRKSKVSTEIIRFKGVIHGFIGMDRWFPEANAAMDRVGSFLAHEFAPEAKISLNSPSLPTKSITSSSMVAN